MPAADVGLVDLDDPLCQDVGLVGAKAASLGRARSSGLPVLPGFVATTALAEQALKSGREALAARGSGGARLAVQRHGMEPALRARVADAVNRLGGPAIVRSSSTVEGSGEWAGAFSSFADIDATSAPTAVVGCWASVFGVDVLERADHLGVPVTDLAMAALVQPMIDPQISGHARLQGDGTVRVTAVRGRPGGLMAGWVAGTPIEVSATDEVGTEGRELLSAEQAREVAHLARSCHSLFGHHSIEWALVEGQVVLFQTGDGPRTESRPPLHVASLDELDHPASDRVAELVRRFPGGLSEELVLPWAIGLRDPRVLQVGPPRSVPASDLTLEALARRADQVATRVWTGVSGVAPWRATLRDLRSAEPGAALRVVADLRPPPVEDCRRLLADLLALGAAAHAQGSLRRAEEIWGCERADLNPSRALHPRQSWAGARRWEPFLAGVAQTRGASHTGTPAAPGIGAGNARLVAGSDVPDEAAPARGVLVAINPVPSLAPLLWNAAGVVTTGGSTGAHLLEVAASLGVPAVVQCTGLRLADITPDTVLAIDGDNGHVSVYRPGIG